MDVVIRTLTDCKHFGCRFRCSGKGNRIAASGKDLTRTSYTGMQDSHLSIGTIIFEILRFNYIWWNKEKSKIEYERSKKFSKKSNDRHDRKDRKSTRLN